METPPVVAESQNAESKLRTIIVDDEPLALELLRSYLGNLSVIDIVAECRNGSEAVDAIIEHQPDLVFLDIQMPGLNGFDVINKLQADIVPLIVFVTAYDEYALSAFDVCAVDYILKPIDLERATRAVDRCMERRGSANDHGNGKSAIVDAMEQINQKTSLANRSITLDSGIQNTHIVVKDQGVVTLIEQADIEWVDAAGDYMCIHASGDTHIMRSTLKDLLDHLNPDVFKRIHRSTIVNLNCIEQILPHTKGEYFLKLRGSERVKVSRNYRGTIKDFLTGFESGESQGG
ncbi:response regulator transcription factor [Porticoccus sp. W117]|uniref:LytR/AlgR family response regulator transcription factor n=1 Tax=Porticoccus sp. W117 TaxID=3054777 RepID=UPI00259680CD|nr:response regulator transcription factor [Porticoccus sp. W117]MDM3870030.1 response regulator transcription factor [Porticoccus sp. W117]